MKIKGGILCEKGWEKLYMPILRDIWKYDDEQINPLDKIGIKEICSIDGKLSIKIENDYNLPREIENRIEYAETESLKYCEYCGKTEELGTTLNNDYVTCCKTCWENHILPMYDNSIWKNYQTQTYLRKSNYTI